LLQGYQSTNLFNNADSGRGVIDFFSYFINIPQLYFKYFTIPGYYFGISIYADIIYSGANG